MAGYASRNKPSEGVLTDLWAKAMAVEDAEGHRAVLLTSDVIGYNRPVAEMIFARITKQTGLTRPQILLSCSHTHTGPVVGISGATGYSLPEEDAKRVHEYAERLAGELVELAAAALADLRPGVQAMFMIGCGGDANPYSRGQVDDARDHGKRLGTEVCRVAAGKLRPVRGPLRTLLGEAAAPLQPVPSREELEKLVKGPGYLAYNYRRMLEAVNKGEPLRTTYDLPIAVWQFGKDLTLVALSGEVVSEYVPLIQRAVGPGNLWIAAYCNDAFGYLPTKKILQEGGYETRGLIPEAGFFAPEAEDAVVAAVGRLVEAAGRTLPE